MSSSSEESDSRVYTINLGKAWITPSYKRTDRVINMIREFATKHMKTDDVKIDQDLNRHVWRKGKTNPPRKIRVKMVKDENDTLVVSLFEETKAETNPKPSETVSAEQTNQA